MKESYRAALEVLGQRASGASPLFYWGTVVSAQTGPPKTLTVTIGATAVPRAAVPYDDTISSPTAGDRVLLLKMGPDWYAISRRAT